MSNDSAYRKIAERKYIKPILIVIFCTLFTSSGQIFWKFASSNLDTFSSIITNIPLILGFVFYGIGAVLLIIALKYADLSLIYPFIALSFVWVNIASIVLFRENISMVNWAGIISITLGVSLIGYGGSR
jgi:multidrug transporter EmrE-like cation transporter